MSDTNVKRNVATWKECIPEPEWFAILECGHQTPDSCDGGLTAYQKEVIVRIGEPIYCSKCSKLEADIAIAQNALDAMKARRKTSNSGVG